MCSELERIWKEAFPVEAVSQHLLGTVAWFIATVVNS
jgi:hypothetical protein